MAISANHANDDDPTTGELVRSLKTPPRLAPLWVAFALSVAWCAAYFWIIGLATFSNAGAKAWGALLVEVGSPILLILTVGELIRRMQQFQTIARVMCLSAQRLTDPVETSTQKVVSLSKAIRQETSALSESLEASYARAQQLQATLRGELVSLIKSHQETETQLKDLVRSVSQVHDTLNGQTVDLVASLHDAKIGLKEALWDAQQNIAANATQAVSSVRSIIETEIDELRSSTVQTGAIVAETLKISAKDLRDAVENGASQIEDTVSRECAIIETRLTNASKTVTDQLDHLGDQIVAQLRYTGSSITSGVSGESARVTSSLNSLQHDMMSSLEGQVVAFSRAMAQSASQIQNQFDASSKVTTQAVESAAARIETRGLETVQELDRATSHVAESLNQASVQIEGMVKEFDAAIFSDLRSRITELSSTVSSMSEQLAESAQASALSATDAMKQTLIGFETNLDEFCKTVDGIEKHLENKLESESLQSSQRLAGLAETIKTNIDQQTLQISEIVGECATTLVTEVGKSLERSNTSMTQTSTNIQHNLNLLSEELSASGDKISMSLSNATTKVSNLESTIADELSSTFTRIDNTVRERGSEFTTSVFAKCEAFTAAINDSSNIVSINIEEASQRAEKTLQRSLVEARDITTSLDDIIALRSKDMGQTISSAVEKLMSELTDVNAQSEAKLDTFAKDLTHAFEGSTTTLGNRITEAASKLDEETARSVTGLSGQLEAANCQAIAQLKEHLQHVELAAASLSGAVSSAFEIEAAAMEGRVNSAVERNIVSARYHLGLAQNDILTQVEQLSTNVGALAYERTNALLSEVEGKFNDFHSFFANSHVSALQDVQDQYEKLTLVVSNHLDTVYKSAAANAKRSEVDLNELVGSLSETEDRIREEIYHLVSKVVSEAKDRLALSMKVLLNSEDRINTSAEKSLAAIKQKLLAAQEEIVANVDWLAETITARTSERADTLIKDAEVKVGEFQSFLVDTHGSTLDVVQERHEKLSLIISHRLEALSRSALASARMPEEAMDELIKSLREAEHPIRQEIQGIIARVISEAKDCLVLSARDLDNNLVSNLDTIAPHSADPVARYNVPKRSHPFPGALNVRVARTLQEKSHGTPFHQNVGHESNHDTRFGYTGADEPESVPVQKIVSRTAIESESGRGGDANIKNPTSSPSIADFIRGLPTDIR
jgi:hypothetical protein